MPRRPDSPELTAARDALRARYEQQQHATNAFYDAAARADRLREQLDRIEAEQHTHATELAMALDPATAAVITGWPVSRIRTTVRDSRRRGAPTVGRPTDDSHQSDAS